MEVAFHREHQYVTMSDTFERVTHLVTTGSVRISEHGYDELMADDIFSHDIVTDIGNGRVVEDYPDYGNPIHVVWGIPKGHSEPAVVVTAYRPDPEQWQDGFMRKRG